MAKYQQEKESSRAGTGGIIPIVVQGEPDLRGTAYEEYLKKDPPHTITGLTHRK